MKKSIPLQLGNSDKEEYFSSLFRIVTVFFDVTLNKWQFIKTSCMWKSLNCISELFLLLNYIPLVYLEIRMDLLLCMICNIISLIIWKIMVQILQIFQMLTHFLNNIKTYLLLPLITSEKAIFWEAAKLRYKFSEIFIFVWNLQFYHWWQMGKYLPKNQVL